MVVGLSRAAGAFVMMADDPTQVTGEQLLTKLAESISVSSKLFWVGFGPKCRAPTIVHASITHNGDSMVRGVDVYRECCS